jgi:hypothetical protein
MDKISFPDMFASKGVHFRNRGAHAIREVAKETHVSPSITLASAVTHFLTVLESVKGQVCDGTKGMSYKFEIKFGFRCFQGI